MVNWNSRQSIFIWYRICPPPNHCWSWKVVWISSHFTNQFVKAIKRIAKVSNFYVALLNGSTIWNQTRYETISLNAIASKNAAIYNLIFSFITIVNRISNSNKKYHILWTICSPHLKSSIQNSPTKWRHKKQ